MPQKQEEQELEAPRTARNRKGLKRGQPAQSWCKDPRVPPQSAQSGDSPPLASRRWRFPVSANYIRCSKFGHSWGRDTQLKEVGKGYNFQKIDGLSEIPHTKEGTQPPSPPRLPESGTTRLLHPRQTPLQENPTSPDKGSVGTDI